MESQPTGNKIASIYELREAVESKARAEYDLAANGTEAARDALLAAQLDVEARTQDAIEVCHECGHDHAEDVAGTFHARMPQRPDNVIPVDFRHRAGA